MDIAGVDCEMCARAMAAQLLEAGVSLPGRLAPNPLTGITRVELECPGWFQLHPLAAHVAQAQSLHRGKRPPRLALVLFADLDRESAMAALEICRTLPGVDLCHCHADIATGELSVGLSGTEAVDPDEIEQVLVDLGIALNRSSTRAAHA